MEKITNSNSKNNLYIISNFCHPRNWYYFIFYIGAIGTAPPQPPFIAPYSLIRLMGGSPHPPFIKYLCFFVLLCLTFLHFTTDDLRLPFRPFIFEDLKRRKNPFKDFIIY